MNRQDPWDWSTPFKVDPQLQALTSQIVPVGGQGNTQAPPPVAPYSSPFQQAMTNRAMNAGFKKIDTEYDKAFPSKPEVPPTPHDPSKVPVEDAVPTPVSQPQAANTVPTLDVGSAAADAQAKALLDEQLAQQGSGGLIAMLTTAAEAA